MLQYYSACMVKSTLYVESMRSSNNVTQMRLSATMLHAAVVFNRSVLFTPFPGPCREKSSSDTTRGAQTESITDSALLSPPPPSPLPSEDGGEGSSAPPRASTPEVNTLSGDHQVSEPILVVESDYTTVTGSPLSEDNMSSVDESPCGKNDPEYVLDTPNRQTLGETRAGTAPFLISAQRLDMLIDDINRTSSCKAEGCNGKLRLKCIQLEGKGGDGQALLCCTGRCGTRDLCLPFSDTHEESKQSVVSFALQVAFICSGTNYAQYKTVLGSMGMYPVPDKMFYDTIRLLQAHTERLLDKQCELAKQEMKKAPPDEIGSWQRAVTVADGAWMTRGHHSQHFTFHVRDYMRNSVLYYKHFSQRGKEPLYKGTSKSMEGKAASEVFEIMAEDGIRLDTHWQDADATSAKEVENHFGPDITRLCGGHYSRAHYNQLKKLKQKKRFGLVEQSKYKDKYPDVLHLTCKCTVYHKQGCGCFTDPFITLARRRLFCALVDAETDPNAMRARLEMLAHHACDEHEWEGGKCDFHPLILCSCGNCTNETLKCDGRRYETMNKLKCEFHKLAYKIELHNRSKQADQVIAPELGRGHTNQLESANSALIKFRQKSWNIQRLHYHASTNLGLLESNLTFMHSIRGTKCHWLPELYDELGLPDFDGVKAFYKAKSRAREARRQKCQPVEYKKGVAVGKHRHRVTEQQKRQEYNMSQKQSHTYKSNVGYSIQCETKTNTNKKKTCVCGSTNHVRRTHKSCPLNKQRQTMPEKASSSQSVESDEEESDFEGFEPDDCVVSSSEEELDCLSDIGDEVEICSCGRAHKRDCPLNPRRKGNITQKTLRTSKKASVGKGKAVAAKRNRAAKTVSAAASKGKGKAVATKRSRAAQTVSSLGSPSSKRLKTVHVRPTPTRVGPKSRLPFNRGAIKSPKPKRLLGNYSTASQKPGTSKKLECSASSSVDSTPECLITAIEPCKDIVVNPPDSKWKADI